MNHALGNIIQAVFGGLSGGFSEKNRAIKIRFSDKYQDLDSALLVQRISGTSSICGGFEYELHCVATTVHIELKNLIAVPVCIELVNDSGQLHTINAVITEAHSGGGDGGFVSYFLKISDAFSLLEQRVNTRVFVNRSIIDVTHAMLSEWREKSELFSQIFTIDDSGLTKEYPLVSFIMQHDENDRSFLFRLWKRWGVSWYWLPLEAQDGTITQKLVLFDDASRLPQNRAATVEFKRDAAVNNRDTVTHFNGMRTLVSGSGNVFQWQHALGTVTNSNVENHRSQGASADANRAFLESAILDSSFQSLTPSEIDRFGLLHVQRKELQAKCFVGQGNVRDFRVGTYFELTGNAELETHPQNERQFVITELWLEAENNIPNRGTEVRIKNLFTSNGWTDKNSKGFSETDPTRYRNTFKAVRRDISIVPMFDPKTDLPHAHTMIATVVAPQGEEVFTDEFSRIQIRIPNTQIEHHQHAAGGGANDSEGDSAWVPLSSSWSGQEFGAVNLPRAGDSVIISFMNGDIDQPYVSGRLFHALRKPPTFNNSSFLPDHRYLSGIKSKEIKGDRHNQLRFDDTPNQISAQLLSQHGQSELNLGYLTHPRVKDGVGAPRGHGLELRTDDFASVRASKGLMLTTHDQANAKGQQMDAAPAKSSLSNNIAQMKALSDSATNQKANPLDALDKLQAAIDALDVQGEGDNVKVFKEAILLLSALADIVSTTAKNIHSHAGANITQSAGESINLSAMKNYTLLTGKGMSLYTADIGVKLFAAKGKVEIQAQSDELDIIAAKVLKLISTQDNIEISSTKNILLTAQGSQIKIGDGGITLSTPNTITRKAAQHNDVGPASVNANMPNFTLSGLFSRRFDFSEHFDTAAIAAGIFYKIINHTKKTETIERLADDGRTVRVFSDHPEDLELHILGSNKDGLPDMLEHPDIDDLVTYNHDADDGDDEDEDESFTSGMGGKILNTAKNFIKDELVLAIKTGNFKNLGDTTAEHARVKVLDSVNQTVAGVIGSTAIGSHVADFLKDEVSSVIKNNNTHDLGSTAAKHARVKVLDSVNQKVGGVVGSAVASAVGSTAVGSHVSDIMKDEASAVIKNNNTHDLGSTVADHVKTKVLDTVSEQISGAVQKVKNAIDDQFDL